MTIHVEDSSVRYVGDGSQTVFAFNFRIFKTDNLHVYVDGTEQVSGYDVFNSEEETGSYVTFDDPPVNQAVIYMERVLPYQQLLDLIAFDRFPAESMEKALDYLCLLTQQNEREAGNIIQADPSIPDDVDMTMPPPGDGEFFKYTDDGKAIETADITKIDKEVIAIATDQEMIDGLQTEERLISPAQVKLGVESHETPPIENVDLVGWVEVVDELPQVPDPTKMYFVRET